MCTLIVFRDFSQRYPLVIAANRDEVPNRPTEKPAYLSQEIFGPQDLVHGGSWIGVNSFGLMAALTNRSLRPRKKGRRSRGLLVTKSLAYPTIEKAANRILKTSAGTYNGFHLLLSDGRQATLIWSEGDELFTEKLERGLFVFTGEGSEPAHNIRDQLIREFIGRGPEVDNPDWLDQLLSFHGPGPEDGTCVHGPEVRMETTFSMTIHWSADCKTWQLRWRPGRPCQKNSWQAREIAITGPEEEQA